MWQYAAAEAVLPSGLRLPECERGIGKVIQSAASPDLIDGVQVFEAKLWPDDRGYFVEVMRFGQGLASEFEADTMQVSAAFNYTGIIKAFHYHQKQTDLWAPTVGMFQVALVDLRNASPTFGLRNTLYLGALRPWHLTIPPGVGHGYKVIGEHPGVLVYVTNRFYDPSDEGRIPYNEPHINYDWELQHK